MIVGVGCDLVDMNRMMQHQDKLAKRVLSINEYTEYCTHQGKRKLEFLAGHFAIKEALVKAMPKPSLLSDFEIFYRCQKPCVHLDGYNVNISLAHDGGFAYAVAIIERV